MPTVQLPPIRPTLPPARREADLEEWQLVRLLDVGCWFQVYQARPRQCSGSQADYVLKLPRADRRDDPVALRMMVRELAVSREVQNEHLVPVLAARLEKEPFYLVGPYLAGSTLQRRLQSGEMVSLPRTLWIIRQAATALAALHQSGWLHGDVKPANLLLAASGHTSLLDLGMAARLSRGCRQEPFTGTIAYAAPEWFAGPDPPGAASDIYSLGWVLIELLAGRELASQNCSASDHTRPPDPRHILPSVPRSVCRLARRMLANEPLRRPTAAEVTELCTRFEIESLDEWGR